MYRRLAAAVLLTVHAAGLAHEVSPTKADFIPPAPGTYRLERIQQAPDGSVLDTRHRKAKLSQYTQGKVTLLSLMYTSCSDEKGCPLAFYTLEVIKRDLQKSGVTRGRVRLVSLSFDPGHDTPEVMRAYAGKHDAAAGNKNRIPWYFLTTESSEQLRPLLDGLDQDVSVPADSTGEPPRELKHVLKVFLIDKQGWVREIYSTSFLVPQVVINDVQTLLIEDGVKLN
jgi:cytochrome oxidase Cu insertion factor (SCO1/SenC/PrrC family)